MDYVATCRTLGALERACDVTALRFRGEMVWPILRLRLFYLLHRGAPAPQVILPAQLHERLQRLHRLCGIDDGRELLAYWKVHGRLERAKTVQVLERLQPCYALFLQCAEHCYEKVGGGRYDPMLDPVAEACARRGGVTKILLGNELGLTKDLTHPGVILALAEDMLAEVAEEALASGELAALDDAAAIEGYGALRAALAELAPGTDLAQERLAEAVRHVFALRAAFLPVLDALKPRLVAMEGYYHPAGLALVGACHARGIPSVDVQHGQQGQYNSFYTWFLRLPPGGYAFLPSHIWTWGEMFKANIDRFAPFGTEIHRTVIGGHPWLTKWAEGYRGDDPHAAELFAARLAGFDRRILLCLQSELADPLPEFLHQAMAASPPGWAWLVRPHPMMSAEAFKAAVAPLRGLEGRLFVDEPAALPLYALLPHVDHHVTTWSTVVHEALAFDVPTTFVHPDARAFLPELFAAGVAVYAGDAEAVLHSIARAPGRDALAAAPRFVRAGADLAQAALAEIEAEGWRSGRP